MLCLSDNADMLFPVQFQIQCNNFVVVT